MVCVIEDGSNHHLPPGTKYHRCMNGRCNRVASSLVSSPSQSKSRVRSRILLLVSSPQLFARLLSLLQQIRENCEHLCQIRRLPFNFTHITSICWQGSEGQVHRQQFLFPLGGLSEPLSLARRNFQKPERNWHTLSTSKHP
jgi:hypothetical protein